HGAVGHLTRSEFAPPSGNTACRKRSAPLAAHRLLTGATPRSHSCPTERNNSRARAMAILSWLCGSLGRDVPLPDSPRVEALTRLGHPYTPRPYPLCGWNCMNNPATLRAAHAPEHLPRASHFPARALRDRG